MDSAALVLTLNPGSGQKEEFMAEETLSIGEACRLLAWGDWSLAGVRWCGSAGPRAVACPGNRPAAGGRRPNRTGPSHAFLAHCRQLSCRCRTLDACALFAGA